MKSRALSDLGSSHRRIAFHCNFVGFVLGAGVLVLALVCFKNSIERRKKTEVREDGGKAASPPGELLCHL